MEKIPEDNQTTTSGASHKEAAMETHKKTKLPALYIVVLALSGLARWADPAER